MSTELNIKDKLYFDDVDLVAPETVVKEFTDQLEGITNGLVEGVIEPYGGHIESYKTETLGALAALGTTREHDIQKDLGAMGYNRSKFELYLTATYLPNYKYRVLFLGYGIGGYPVKVVLEESIARTIKGGSDVCLLSNRAELEDLIHRILSSPRVINIIQELINATRIEQDRKPESVIEAVEATPKEE